MKIGILTYHRAYNYGAVLQCYALKEVLTRIGHDVYVIDYRQPDIERFYKFKTSFLLVNNKNLSFAKRILNLFLTPIRDLKNIIIHYRFKKVFEGFQKRRLNLTSIYVSDIPDDFDAYIIGSDMLWAYDATTLKFESKYLGQFIRKSESKLIGYAISGTPDSFRKLGDEMCFDFLSNFDAFSVRERSLANIVTAYTGKDVVCCIDPTLLTTKDIWRDFTFTKPRKKKYIVTYYLRLSGVKKNELNAKLTKLATQQGFEIINIEVKGSKMPISVESFVSIIKDAQYIVTDSFHGVVFSLIFGRPLHALKLNDSHDTRYVDILHTIGADDLVVDYNFMPYIPSIDYEKLNITLEQFRKSSMDFLYDSL